jgi:hypothetical protein
MKRIILTLLLAWPVTFGLVNAEGIMFVDCLRAFQVSVALADQELQEDLNHCRDDADWLLRSWCRKEADLAHDSSVTSSLNSYNNCEFGMH